MGEGGACKGGNLIPWWFCGAISGSSKTSGPINCDIAGSANWKSPQMSNMSVEVTVGASSPKSLFSREMESPKLSYTALVTSESCDRLVPRVLIRLGSLSLAVPSKSLCACIEAARRGDKLLRLRLLPLLGVRILSGWKFLVWRVMTSLRDEDNLQYKQENGLSARSAGHCLMIQVTLLPRGETHGFSGGVLDAPAD